MAGTIIITGGGTGGHTFPALAVYDELAEKWKGKFVWVGSRRGMEKKIVQNRGIRYYGIPVGKLRRYLSLQNILDIFNVLAGICYSILIMLKEKPCCIFSKGGYVSVPPVLAGALCGIKIFTHESDLDPGLATRINARFAYKIFTSFQKTGNYFNEKIKPRVCWTGTPVRAEILAGDPGKGKKIVGCPGGTPMILVLGGSQGALAINSAILKILDSLIGKYFIVHQMGQKGFRPLQKKNYYPSPFFKSELPHIMSAADLVVSRGGANSLWELAVLKIPSLIIPLSRTRSRGDQIRNALVFQKAGASYVLEEGPDLSKKLLEHIFKIMDNRDILQKMKASISKLTIPNAAKKIADLILMNEKETDLV